MKLALLALVAAPLAACTSLPVDRAAVGHGPTAAGAASAERPPAEPARLYARDGSVVAASPRGEVTPSEELVHDLQPSSGGRMYILELYQQVLDERDALQLELRRVGAENERARAQTAEVEAALAALEASFAALDAEKRALLEENLDLAGRLTTAQIRRLEAERLLLEARIRDVERAAPLAETAQASSGDPH